jgi:hypothetical protein
MDTVILTALADCKLCSNDGQSLEQQTSDTHPQHIRRHNASHVPEKSTESARSAAALQLISLVAYAAASSTLTSFVATELKIPLYNEKCPPCVLPEGERIPSVERMSNPDARTPHLFGRREI